MPDPTPTQGGAPATPAAAAATTVAPAAIAVTRTEVDAFTARLIGNHGTAESALRQIAGEQIRFRKRAQNAEARATAAEQKLAAGVLLTGAEATAYTELKTAGVTLDKVPARLSQLTKLETETTTKSVDVNLTAAVGKTYKLSLLKKVLGSDVKLEFDTVKVKGKDKDGKDTIEDTKVAYIITGAGDTKTREQLTQFIEREHKDLLDVLKATPEQGSDGKGEQQRRSGLNVPRQTSSTSTAPKEDDSLKVVDSTLGSKYQSPGQRAKAAAGGDKS